MKNKKHRGLVRWFQSQKIWKKILYAFIISAIVPLIVSQVLLVYINMTSMKGKVDELMVNELVQMAERVDLTMEIYINLVWQLSSDSQVIDNIANQLDEDYETDEVAKWEIYDRIRQYDVSANGIECISIVLQDGQSITYDFKNASTVQNIWNEYEDLRETEPYQRAQETSGIAITPTDEYGSGENVQYLFHISKKIYDYNRLEKGSVATLIMSIDGKELDKICTVDYQHDPQQEHNVNFIIDRDGYILAYPDLSYAGEQIQKQESVEEFVQSTGRLEGKNISYNQYEDKKLGWVFYNVYDRAYLLDEVIDGLGLAVGVAIFFTIFAVVMICSMTNSIKSSLQSLMQGIRQVHEGNLDVKVVAGAEDEFAEIAQNFNSMTGKLQDLFDEVTKATQKQKEAEIRALEAQINPHFLYNTLDSINWMAIDKGEYEISKMLRDLGVILRYSVNKSNQVVKMQEEIEWLEKYVSLQQLRFNYSFSFELYAEEEARNVRVHKLLLQPFIENAIDHGFKEIVSGGELRVNLVFSEDKSMLYAIIEDNGKGMTPEDTRKYNDKEYILNGGGPGIGLVNSFTRLYMYYGKEADWNVSSILSVGTVITLKIPVQEN